MKTTNTHSGPAREQRNGGHQPEKGNGEPKAQKKNGESKNGAKNGAPQAQKKNGEPKAEKKNGEPKNGTKGVEPKAAKNHGQPKGTKHTEAQPKGNILGYRAHCEEEAHFPTTSLLLPDLESMKRWVGKMHGSLAHVHCLWKAEQLFVGDDAHLYSWVGEMDEEHPGTGLIQWSQNPPFDLGPLGDLISPERLLELAAQGFKEAAIQMAPSTKAESNASGETPREKAKKAIGESQPAPKPSQSSERTARAKSRQAKSTPPKRVPTRAFRVKGASKHAKRT